MKKIFACFFVSLISVFCIYSQVSIMTAGSFFQQVSEYYGTIKDYEANVAILAGKSEMQGKVSFKKPDMLRIDFSNPETQVIVFDGDSLTIFLPKSSAVLTQTVSDDSESSGANLATPQGLALMNRYYSIAYETGPDPVPFDSKNPKSEKVIKLLLSRKNASEGFRRIVLSIVPSSKLIRSVYALSTNDEEFMFTFTDYAINQNIPDTRFLYDAPPSANEYNNFLFSE